MNTCSEEAEPSAGPSGTGKGRALVFAALALAATCEFFMAPLSAADLPTGKEPAPPVIAALPVSSFEGAYVGGAIGAEWARKKKGRHRAVRAAAGESGLRPLAYQPGKDGL